MLHEDSSVGLSTERSVSMGWVSEGCEGTGLTTKGVSQGGAAACGVSRGLTPRREGASKGKATIHAGGLPGWGRTVHLSENSKFISGLSEHEGFCGCMLNPAMGSQTSWVQGAAWSTVPNKVGSRVTQPSVASCCSFWCALCLAEPYAWKTGGRASIGLSGMWHDWKRLWPGSTRILVGPSKSSSAERAPCSKHPRAQEVRAGLREAPCCVRYLPDPTRGHLPVKAREVGNGHAALMHNSPNTVHAAQRSNELRMRTPSKGVSSSPELAACVGLAGGQVDPSNCIRLRRRRSVNCWGRLMVPPVGPMRVESYWCQSSCVRGEVWSLGATMTIPALSSKCCSVTRIMPGALYRA